MYFFILELCFALLSIFILLPVWCSGLHTCYQYNFVLKMLLLLSDSAERPKSMRQILQAGLIRTTTHLFPIKECCLPCRHVATQPKMYVGTLHVSKTLFGSLAHRYTSSARKTRGSHLQSQQKSIHKRWMSKSIQSEGSEELSLDNPRVQAYLRKLREDFAATLHGQDEARVQVARGQRELMMLLEQVSWN